MALQSTTPLATVTLQAASSTVTFSGIPNTYRDLIILVSYSPTSTESSFFRFNGDDGTNYNRVLMYGTGSSALSTSNASVNRMRPGTGVAGNQMNLLISVLDYADTNKHKSVLTRFNDAGNETAAGAFRWASTPAINSITFGQDASGSFAAGSTFSLYGRIA